MENKERAVRVADIQVSGGLDTGNGYMKGILKSENSEIIVDYPSVVSIYDVENDIKTEGENIKAEISDIFNRMDLSISSDLITDGRRRIFGKRAVESGMVTTTFDVNLHQQSKAEQKMSGLMVLGTFAGAVLKKWFEKHGKLPENVIQATVSCVLALPIAEYLKYRDKYIEGFKKGTHMVTFHNFSEPVRVELTFENVIVTSEGAAAQFAISSGLADLSSEITSEMKQEGINEKELMAATDVMGIDIGEGTVNFVVMKNKKLSPEASWMVAEGYGTLLDECISQTLKKNGYPFNGRKDLSEFLIKTPKPIEKAKHRVVTELVEDEALKFAERLITEVRKSIAKTGTTNQAIFIYGGGSIPLRKAIETGVRKNASELGNTYVIYISSKDARTLNAKGLYEMSTKLFKK